MARTSRKVIKIPTPESLAAAALHYLSRYAASEQSLRRTLANKLRRAAMAHPVFAADDAARTRLNEVIEGIIERHRKSGVLNDAAFAEMKVHSLRRAGRSRRAIQQTLSMKGVKADTIAKVFEERDEEGAGAAEMKAAQALAKRRRLGAFRTGETSLEQKRKDLATLARAGFSLDIARRALGAVRDDDLDGDFTEDDI